MDESFGSRAQVTAPPGVLSEPTSVSIDVFPDPIGVPPPTGFQAEGTLFVNIQLIPAPSYPLPAPGLTVVLPLTSARIPGSSLHLFRVNPSTGRLEAAVGVDGNPVIGTVNGPDGLSATFAGIARLSTVVGLVPNAIPVSIDIAPGSSTNPINTKSGGVIPVAVLGSASFHVQTINVTKLWFGPASAKPAHNLSEPLTYASHLQDVNGDGFTDLVLHFPQRDTGLNAGATNACLYGENLQATPVIGCDSVRVLQ